MPVMPARPSEAPMTFRNPRRETESSHSEAPLGNSRCRASLNSSLPASSSSERQYSGPVFSRASWAVASVDALADDVEVQLLRRTDVFALLDLDQAAVIFFVVHAVGCILSPLRGFAIASATQPCSTGQSSFARRTADGGCPHINFYNPKTTCDTCCSS